MFVYNYSNNIYWKVLPRILESLTDHLFVDTKYKMLKQLVPFYRLHSIIISLKISKNSGIFYLFDQ